MGLDIGDRRIGVALSDPRGVLASPFTIIECGREEQDIAAIVDIVTRQKVGRIVVGWPRTLNGVVGQQAAKVEAFAEQLRRHISIPVELRDERLSTVSARHLIQTGSSRGRKRKYRYDDAAAAVILQGYLEEGQ